MQGYALRLVVRRKLASNDELNFMGNIADDDYVDSTTCRADLLKGVNAVVHLASRVHVMKEKSPDPL